MWWLPLVLGCSDFALRARDEGPPAQGSDTGERMPTEDTDTDPSDTPRDTGAAWTAPEKTCRTDGTIHLEDGIAMEREATFDPDNITDQYFAVSAFPTRAGGRDAVWAATHYGGRTAYSYFHEGDGAYLLTFDDWRPSLPSTVQPRVIDDWHQWMMYPSGSDLRVTEDSDGSGVAFLLDSGSHQSQPYCCGTYDAAYKWAIAAFDETPVQPTGATAADIWIDGLDMTAAAEPRWADVDGDGLDDLFLSHLRDQHTGEGLLWAAPLSGGLTQADGTSLYTYTDTDSDPLLDRGADLQDLNEDGYADLVVGGQQGAVHVFFGPLTSRLDWSAGDVVYLPADDRVLRPVTGLTLGWTPSVYGYPASDMTGDGEPDLIVGGQPLGGMEGSDTDVYVAWDHSTGTHAIADAAWFVGKEPYEPTLGDDPGLSLVGDVTGDGLTDLWVGALEAREGWRDVLVTSPVEHNIAIDPRSPGAGAVTFEVPHLANFAVEKEVYAAGDLDGDGIGDFMMRWHDFDTQNPAPAQLILFRGCNEW